MKGCAEWEEAIAECALGGAPPEAGLAAHLETCATCTNALRESRAMAARMDEVLGRRAAVEPPLYGPARVMARVGEREAPRWRWAVAGGLAFALLMAVWVGRPRHEAEVPVLSQWRSPTEALLRPPVRAAWSTTPRLGEGFFKIKPLGETNAQ